jgi:hypothetical protein
VAQIENTEQTVEEQDGKRAYTKAYDLSLLAKFYVSEANKYDSGELIYDIKKLKLLIHQDMLLFITDTNDDGEYFEEYEWNMKA